MLDRTLAPAIKEIENIEFLEPEKWTLSNGIKIYGLNAGSQELVKIDFIFDAGVWYQPFNLVSVFTSSFMNQGSKNYSAQQIAEAFDSKGAYLQFSADQQFGTVSLLTLNKHLNEVLKVSSDVIKHPTYPEKEVNAQLSKRKQQFQIENSKVEILAQKKFSQVLFGKSHPYANTNIISDYDLITSEILQDFHVKHYSPLTCKIVVAGRYGDDLKNLLEQHFGGAEWKPQLELNTSSFKIAPSSKRQHWVSKKDAVQTAIKIGKQIPNRTHTDFHGLLVLSTILGGYFGSRLMMNIREDKGYTYGIGSSIYAQLNAAYFAIGTEVGCDVTPAAINEIYFEIEKLQQERVPENELENVRNYLLGETLRNFDGIFAMSSILRPLIDYGLDYSHYKTYIEVLKNISSTEIQQLAQTYLNKSDLFEIISGKKSASA